MTYSRGCRSVQSEAGETYYREIAGVEANNVEESSRTVELSFSSESPVSRWGDVEYLSHDQGAADLKRLEEMGVLLWNHKSDVPIGSIEKVWIDESARKGRALVRFDDDEESDRIYRKVLAGSLKSVSVGYRVENWEKVPAGGTSSNGRFAGPCYVGTRWEGLEISIVSVPADPSVGVGRSVDEKGGDDGVKGNLSLPGDEVGNGAAPEPKRNDLAVNDGREENRSAADDLRNGERGNPSSGETVVRAIRAERERVAEIQEMGRSFDIDLGEFIRSGAELDTVRSEVMKKLKEMRQAISVPGRVTEDEKEKFRSAARDALLIRGGLPVEEPAAGSMDLRGYRLERMAEECLTRMGERVGGNPMEMIGRALTTSDLPVILGSVANVSLMEGWGVQEESYLKWMDDSGVVTDFKEHTGARAGEVDDLLPLPESGEYKSGSMGEESEAWKIGTFGRMFSISRQSIVNDALGVLTDIPRKMGEAARRKVADVGYQAFLDNPKMGDKKDLFCTHHGNLQPAAAFSFTDFEATLTALSLMVQAMKRQTDLSGKRRLNIIPKFLVVPVALELAARRFLKQTETPLSVDTAANKANGGGANPYAGAFELVSDPRLDDVSETAFYMAAEKGKTVKLFFLNGIKEPYLEQQQGWNVDGTSYKVRIDVGAKAMDWRGFQKNPGA
ncbi:peptidase U35 phage prohead HK97 [Dethiosulfovibrio peptidovorans DSM 11002]|uniref:Peptidase U35 phage prohead HK97 n=1 Tax=Dethiosulfovibrio peptidovorans DSM 11002 TaxID=469381 RepID=D2Z298_9BACT|nr:prohead protease/major capsid protein fusion protein [Dethiosulfovibrio peptidovorans]EFC90054.1 peptidase U35 phage prohead HK97 [Dethiosulfovibrio peptidovorans DSM 11002]